METSDLFNQIASHYDHWSNLLSGEGIRAWHHFAIDQLNIQAGNAVLDVGCGTGTITNLMALKAGPTGHVTGLDPSSAMLQEARLQPMHEQSAPINWVQGQGEHLPFADGQFDCVTAQFSMRNMEDWVQGLREMARVLKPSGRLVILEVVQPTSSLGSLAWNGLKAVTQRLTGNTVKAYQWLGLSVEHAPTRDEFAFEARRTGISDVKIHHWLGDLVMVLSGQKESGAEISVAVDTPRVLWAVDGSVTALNAAAWINQVVAPGCAVDIVTVIPPVSVAPEVANNDARVWRRHAHRAQATLTPGRFSVSVNVLNGQPGPELLRFARDHEVGLLIVGNKGRSTRADKMVGSVARYVAAHANCPVLMVPTEVLAVSARQ
jgi:demethylmenaquinone methyltransferase/2-methoxy-6-polyprenyl-1,4-benzoquinol methylase